MVHEVREHAFQLARRSTRRAARPDVTETVRGVGSPLMATKPFSPREKAIALAPLSHQ